MGVGTDAGFLIPIEKPIPFWVGKSFFWVQMQVWPLVPQGLPVQIPINKYNGLCDSQQLNATEYT